MESFANIKHPIKPFGAVDCSVYKRPLEKQMTLDIYMGEEQPLNQLHMRLRASIPASCALSSMCQL